MYTDTAVRRKGFLCSNTKMYSYMCKVYRQEWNFKEMSIYLLAYHSRVLPIIFIHHGLLLFVDLGFEAMGDLYMT